ncbi:MAG: hypothetical protein ACRCXX_14420 [Cetobacterium sp.]|uniref:hypothetical protein n=1 Tax=Cetobacterium sp. TaxID=2071632 RepID=UPI003F3DE785
MNNILTALQNNLLGAIIFKNSEGKILTCKSDFNNGNIGIPMVKIRLNETNKVPTGKANPNDISVQMIEAMRSEFGIDPQILDYYDTTKIPYKLNGTMVLGNCVGYDFSEAEDYKGKPEIVQRPSGIYTDISFRTVAQIEALMENKTFDINSFYFILRYKERVS